MHHFLGQPTHSPNPHHFYFLIGQMSQNRALADRQSLSDLTERV